MIINEAHNALWVTCCLLSIKIIWPGQSALVSLPAVQSVQTAVRLTTVVVVAHREHCPISCSVSVERPYNTWARSAFHRRVTRLMSKCSSSGHRSVPLHWTTFSLSAVRHLGFDRKWILSVLQTPRIHSGPALQVSVKLADAWPSYCNLTNFPRPFLQGTGWFVLPFLGDRHRQSPELYEYISDMLLHFATSAAQKGLGSDRGQIL